MGPFLRSVTEHRIGYLEECFLELGHPEEEARYRALLLYMAHASTVRLLREVPDFMPHSKNYGAYRRHLSSTFMPEREGG